MNNIKTLRNQFELSQKQLAEKLGINQASVCRWELGTALPDTKNLLLLSEIFNVSTDYVLGISQFHFPANVGKNNLFTFEELEIIEDYRTLPEPLKQTIKSTLKTFAQSSKE